jgi:hypothetical protein
MPSSYSNEFDSKLIAYFGLLKSNSIEIKGYKNQLKEDTILSHDKAAEQINSFINMIIDDLEAGNKGSYEDYINRINDTVTTLQSKFDRDIRVTQKNMVKIMPMKVIKFSMFLASYIKEIYAWFSDTKNKELTSKRISLLREKKWVPIRGS